MKELPAGTTSSCLVNRFVALDKFVRYNSNEQTVSLLMIQQLGTLFQQVLELADEVVKSLESLGIFDTVLRQELKDLRNFVYNTSSVFQSARFMWPRFTQAYKLTSNALVKLIELELELDQQ